MLPCVRADSRAEGQKIQDEPRNLVLESKEMLKEWDMSKGHKSHLKVLPLDKLETV